MASVGAPLREPIGFWVHSLQVVYRGKAPGVGSALEAETILAILCLFAKTSTKFARA